MQGNVTYSLGITVRNIASERAEASNLSIWGSIKSKQTVSLMLQQSLSVLSGVYTPLLGPKNASSPLRVLVPDLWSSQMTQSQPWTWCTNTLTVTLRSSADLPVGSIVTVLGLNGIYDNAVNVSSQPPGFGSGEILDQQGAGKNHPYGAYVLFD
jgi:hypothetical protein